MINDPESLRIEPLTTITGAVVTGLDAAAKIPEATRLKLREAWWRYGLLLLPGQNIDEDQQREFGMIFGEISSEGEYGDQNYVSNVIPEGIVPYGELAFHVDHSWSPSPLRGLMLYAIECPPKGNGGETKFADAKRAYDALPEVTRRTIDTLQIVHTYPDQSKNLPIPGPDPRPGMPTATHPLAFPHPATGEKLLFCSPRHFDRIVGYTPQESLALAEQLSAHLSRPEIIYTHSWAPGDLIVWDNLRLQHARTHFDPKFRRHLRRTQIGEPGIHGGRA